MAATPASPADYRFCADWSETATLADGRRIRYRLLQPTDRDKIVEGLARMSERSRYLRFFTDKPRLTDAELRYLTEIDQVDHFAIVAGLVEPDGSEGPGVGLGRFVRILDEPAVADPAVAVVDDLQGHGIGRQLMTYLIGAAVERGIQSFRTEFLAVNKPMRELLVELSPQTTFVPDGAMVVAEFPLPGAEQGLVVQAAPQYEGLRAALRLVASDAAELFSARLAEYLDPERLRERLRRWAERLRGVSAGDGTDADAD